jgi:hypothetical protein
MFTSMRTALYTSTVMGSRAKPPESDLFDVDLILPGNEVHELVVPGTVGHHGPALSRTEVGSVTTACGMVAPVASFTEPTMDP